MYPRAPEVCDGKDNNCDGEIDEGCCEDNDGDGHYAIAANCPEGDDCNDNDSTIYPGATELCDGKDNNCDGQIDEGFSVGIPCSVGIGACQRDGVTICSSDGSGTVCSATPGEPSPEICDGIDNDCNGVIDDLPLLSCYSGPPGTENVGVCRAGTQTCTNGQWGACQGEVLPQTEICDGIDNNCNGQVDETCEGCTQNSTGMGSSANLSSGNLYHSQALFQIPNSKLQTDFSLAYNSIDIYNGPLGKGWTHNYNLLLFSNPDGSLGLKQGDGNTVYFWPSQGIYYPESRSGETSYIINNPDSTYTQITKEGITYNFNSSGRLTSIRDRNGNTTTLTYSGDNLISIIDQSGRTIQITTSGGRITSITDSAGRVYTLTYTGDFLSAITDPLGNAWQFTYDPSGRMLTKTDPQGYITTYTYDANGRVITSTDPEGRTKSISYDQINNTATVTEKDGGIWTYKYDPALNVPLEITDPQGGRTTYIYDENRNLISETDPEGNTTTYTYDDKGNLTSITDPMGNITRYTYNEFGQVTSIIDSEGNVTRYTYDEKGNLTSITDPTGAVTQYQYDSKGNIISIINPLNQTTTFTYDSYNNLISITDPAGATTRFTYDSVGNMTSQIDPLGNITIFEYNSLNQLIKVTDPLGNVTTYTYDANGNRTSQTDANGNTTYYKYNYKGQLTKVTDALGNVTTYTYGGTGCSTCGGGEDNLTGITDAKGQTTIYQYDLLGRLIRETDPLGNTITYTYDSKGNLTSKTDANGNTIHYTYDLLNRLTKKTYPDATVEVFQYDTKGNITYAGNQNIAYSFLYDSNNRILSVTDSNGMTIGYQYDALGNRISMATPEGKIIDYTYDSNNRLSQMLSDAGNFSFTYDSTGRRTILTYPNGATANYTYDSSGRLTSLTHKTSSGSTIDSFEYTHDKVGNRLSKTETDKKTAYSYDPIYRLIQALPTKLQGKDKTQENKQELFTYDPVGNRQTGPDANDYYYHNQGNQLTSDSKHQYQYDGNGNLINKTETDDDGKVKIWTYFYDYENRLVQVIKQEENEVVIVSFGYDPFGRRIWKVVEEQRDEVTETKTYNYVYDNEDIILEYLTKSDGKIETTRYVHGLGIDEPLAIDRDGDVYYYHADGLGSIIALTDSRQKVVESYTYTSFGEVKRQGDKVKNTYTFTGREWDEEIGLYYYRARYYYPRVGRFIQFDPALHFVNRLSQKYSTCRNSRIPLLFDNPQNLNPYIYSRNNPVRFLDRNGMATIDSTCPSDKKAEIEKATATASSTAKGCLPEPLNSEVQAKFSDLLIKCDNEPYCGWAYTSGNEINLSGGAFRPSCGCLESTILHEVIHTTGRGDDAAYGCEKKCFNCGSQRGDSCACK